MRSGDNQRARRDRRGMIGRLTAQRHGDAATTPSAPSASRAIRGTDPARGVLRLRGV